MDKNIKNKEKDFFKETKPNQNRLKQNKTEANQNKDSYSEESKRYHGRHCLIS